MGIGIFNSFAMRAKMDAKIQFHDSKHPGLWSNTERELGSFKVPAIFSKPVQQYGSKEYKWHH